MRPKRSVESGWIFFCLVKWWNMFRCLLWIFIASRGVERECEGGKGISPINWKKYFQYLKGFFFWIIKLAPSCICTVAMPNIRQKLFMKLGEKHGVRVWEEEEFRYSKRKKSWRLIAHVDCRCRRWTGNIRLISYLALSHPLSWVVVGSWYQSQCQSKLLLLFKKWTDSAHEFQMKYV